MKAIVRFEYGSPDVLELADVDTPVVGDDGVLVRVRAASLNAADLDYLYGKPLLTRMGTGLLKPRNRGLGLDVAGQVEAVGRDVTQFRPGDEVFGDMTAFGYGAFAELVAAPERAWAPKPAGMTFEEAATVPQAAILALQGLRGRGRRVQPGQRVLVNGASGNVGPFAVQIAKAVGAEVTGVCSTGKTDLVRELGADHVIDYTRTDVTTTGERYDVILQLAGTASPGRLRRALVPGGTLVLSNGEGRFAGVDRIVRAIALNPFVRERLAVFVTNENGADLATLAGMIESGQVRPVIDRTYPLADAAEALRYLEAGHARGKVVIAV